jgi:hypothetical protein
VKKREDSFVLENATAQTVRAENSRKNESFYGVVVSPTDSNKTGTKVRVLYYPKGKVEEVMKSRLDFAEAPPNVNEAEQKFLDSFDQVFLEDYGETQLQRA